jgi:tyrosinase
MALTVRMNQAFLTKDQRDRFVAAVLKMKADGIYDWYVQTHLDSMGTPNGSKTMNMWAHRRPAFLPWHRQFILDFENDMRAADTTLTGKPSDLGLPYWDWTSDRSKNPYLIWGQMWDDAFMGPDGSGPDNKVSSGPFRATDPTHQGWVPSYDAGADYQAAAPGPAFLQRLLGRDPGGSDSLPTQEEWLAARNIKTYDDTPFDSGVGQMPPTLQFTGVKSFRNALEGWIGYYGDPISLSIAAVAAGTDPNWSPAPSLHNRVHTWVSGSMGPMSSPNDPVFFLHHCNVDRLWAQWWSDDPTRLYAPAHGVKDPTDPGEMGGPTINLTGHHVDDPMPPWDGRAATRKGTTGNMPTVTPGGILNHIHLGYAYFPDDAPQFSAKSTP